VSVKPAKTNVELSGLEANLEAHILTNFL